MFTLLGKFFDTNEREIRKLIPIVENINTLEDQVKKQKDTDFAKKTGELKDRAASGESLDLLLPEAFALVREAARRSLGQRHFDVQLMAGIVLHQGKIAEQKTGEGKTLSAVPALYLNALLGRGVQLVTVNDYLARRDCGWMGPIFHLLGLRTCAIINDASFIYDPDYTSSQAPDERLRHLRSISRREAYEADVTYGINSEFGFDYLRDNMTSGLTQVVQRGHHFAIVDEVDSVLIDEARTPHIISAPDVKPSERYYQYARLVEKLNPHTDYVIDEKLRTAHLTEHGVEKIEKLFGIENIYEKDFDAVYHLEVALKARTLFQKDRDYVVKDSQIIIVDEFTGRLMFGRRFSEGLHQALEAKEGVSIQPESKTLATVSLQNYFRMYEKLSGMTGTAVTEAEEFYKIYKLEVVVVPTHRPMIRKDHPDVVYKTTRAKYAAVVRAIEDAYKRGEPVLVGTTSIEKNEIVSEFLKRKGIPHEVLNAKNHEREAAIIAKAGRKKAVTIATNMAGRGVDIILGGDVVDQRQWQKEHEEVVRLGGLYVIGTERHEARRIDNQLRGRSGRQGDPGSSRFFVALDDDIMRLFGGEQIARLMTTFQMPEDVPLEHPIVSRAIEQAQIKVEGFNFDIRKHLVEYDDVLNKQRDIIYTLRKKVLFAQREIELKDEILAKIQKEIAGIVTLLSGEYESEDGRTPEELIVESFSTIVPFDEPSKKQIVTQIRGLPTIDERIDFLTRLTLDVYSKREKELGVELMRQVERFVMLSVVDNLWMEHLDSIDDLREGIGLRGYAQKDPLVEYKNEAFSMFERLMGAIDDEIVHRIYKVQVQPSPQAQSTDKSQPPTAPSGSSVVGSQSTIDSKKKLGRNDPCPCGSGKKWKKCHYPN